MSFLVAIHQAAIYQQSTIYNFWRTADSYPFRQPNLSHKIDYPGGHTLPSVPHGSSAELVLLPLPLIGCTRFLKHYQTFTAKWVFISHHGILIHIIQKKWSEFIYSQAHTHSYINILQSWHGTAPSELMLIYKYMQSQDLTL